VKWIFTARPVALTAAIQRGSGQSAKVEAILWCCGNRTFKASAASRAPSPMREIMAQGHVQRGDVRPGLAA
jgi:hypothetical protein